MGTYFTMGHERAEEIAACEPGLTAEIVEDICCDQDWPEGDDHQRWLDTAPAAEIADWVSGIRRDDVDQER